MKRNHNRRRSIDCGLALVAALLCLTGFNSRAADDFTPEERGHWAYQPVKRSRPPALRDRWIRNPVDAFILSGLQARHLAPSAPTDRATLLRRVTLDLTGLPPTPRELDDFLADTSAGAFEKVVDRLLDSPQYGERWARHWLDLARYAESEGFKADEDRPYAWRYRDYVIKAFNEDRPYDRFVQEQIAGDELWPDNPDALVATAFNRHYPDESNARNLVQRRQEILNDITDTVGAVFTGLTISCARCHDHKFDAIRQTDYFRLQAYFANTASADRIVLTSPEEERRHRSQLEVWEVATRPVREEMEAIEAPKRLEIIKDYVDKYPEEIQAALAKPETNRTAFECQMVAKAKLYVSPESHQYIATSKTVAASLKGDQKARWEELNQELKKFQNLHPGNLPIGTGVRDLSAAAPATHLLRKGNWDAPKEVVEPGFLQVLGLKSVKASPLPNSTGRRTALARILTDPANPLTARVMVNRIWQHHFGRGLVGSASDFGVKGDRPLNPALLDWLAGEFVKQGWSMKAMHRLIVTSSTYQQSSVNRDQAARIDPNNDLLWRFPRQRLEGEAIRDAALAVSGRLNLKQGGPSVFPELPAGMESRGGWRLSGDASERDRRSVYVFVRRNTRYPMFETFDMPDTHESCARRNITTSPSQALTMMNSNLTVEWARGLADRVLQAAGANRRKQIETAFRFACGRRPDAAEVRLVERFMESQARVVAEREQEGEDLALPAQRPEGMSATEAAVLVDFCHTLLNSNEFVYIN